MDIPEKIVNKILRGELRGEHGLETDSDSMYFNLRQKGYSDLEAQYKVYNFRGLL